jgi:hypothetical protein
MSSPDEIKDLALDLIGETTESNLLDDTTDGRKLRRGYDSTLRILLSSYAWRFAKKYGVIAATTGTPTGDQWTFQYQLPSDSLRPRRIQENDRISWLRVGDKLWTNEGAPITLEYTELVTDTGRWPGGFEAAFIKRLGSVYAGTFKHDSAKVRELLAEYYELDLPEARTADAKEASIEKLWVPNLTSDVRKF